MLFYLVPVIGGIAVFLAMPGRRPTARVAPVVLGAIAVGAMVGLLWSGVGHSAVLFYILAAVAVVAAARVVTHPKPIYSAVYFLLLVLSVASIALFGGAEFLAAALVIIYAGAILVTYVFVIMLAQQTTPPDYDTEAREPLYACLAGFVLIASLGVMVLADPTAKVKAEIASAVAPAIKSWSNTAALGTELMTTYVVAFEAAGVLLLVGIIGGIAMAVRRMTAVSDDTPGGAV